MPDDVIFVWLLYSPPLYLRFGLPFPISSAVRSCDLVITSPSIRPQNCLMTKQVEQWKLPE